MYLWPEPLTPDSAATGCAARAEASISPQRMVAGLVRSSAELRPAQHRRCTHACTHAHTRTHARAHTLAHVRSSGGSDPPMPIQVSRPSVKHGVKAREGCQCRQCPARGDARAFFCARAREGWVATWHDPNAVASSATSMLDPAPRAWPSRANPPFSQPAAEPSPRPTRGALRLILRPIRA
jgi:hypothetical protein